VVAYLCHEIRNPLNAMAKCLELINMELRAGKQTPDR
jgi:hypothetical protein